MSDDLLTRHNLHLSRVTMDLPTRLETFASTCTTAAPSTVEDYIRESLSENTRAAYLSDLKHFEDWGGNIPASPETVAAYLVAHASSHAVATLTRRIAALAKVHRSRGFSNPTSAELVKSALRGLKRVKGTAQRQASPLVKEDLFLALQATGESLKDIRDRALLLVGFAGAFRRSELVGLDCSDAVSVRQGLEVTVRWSKTDQTGTGRKIGIPHARGKWCPVGALEKWLATSNFTEGAIFRPIDRHHRISENRLSGEAVCSIVRERVQAAGINSREYSGHSLRAGLATSAAQAGVSTWKIKQQTGHASDAMLRRYIRDGELFIGNAAGALL